MGGGFPGGMGGGFPGGMGSGFPGGGGGGGQVHIVLLSHWVEALQAVGDILWQASARRITRTRLFTAVVI